MNEDINFIDVEKLKRMQMLHVRFLLFDVRTSEAFQVEHIKSAFNLPNSSFLENIEKQVPIKETPIVIYDQDGFLCPELARACEKLGYLNVVVLEGGFSAYVATRR